jgi:hypothetical protein
MTIKEDHALRAFKALNRAPQDDAVQVLLGAMVTRPGPTSIWTVCLTAAGGDERIATRTLQAGLLSAMESDLKKVKPVLYQMLQLRLRAFPGPDEVADYNAAKYTIAAIARDHDVMTGRINTQNLDPLAQTNRRIEVAGLAMVLDSLWADPYRSSGWRELLTLAIKLGGYRTLANHIATVARSAYLTARKDQPKGLVAA